jgi:hypothetical protein
MTDKERIEQEEPDEDPALRRLLGLWRAPAVPDSLDARMISSFRQVTDRRSWWSRLLTISVPVPLPVAVAALVLLIASALVVVRRPATPRESPEVLEARQTANLDTPVVTRTSLAGFEPVEDMNVTIVTGERQ